MHGLAETTCSVCGQPPAPSSRGRRTRNRGSVRSAGTTGGTVDPALADRVSRARALITRLARDGVEDAMAIADRQAGTNNLQGHAQSLVPLAVWFLDRAPEEATQLRARTDLRSGMGQGSHESRDSALWDPIADRLADELAVAGHELIAEPLRNGPAQTAWDAAHYLPLKYGGTQTTGGGGATVFKRACKLLAHHPL